MEIQTHSHIDADHAAGPYFPEATSADGRFSWHHGMPGYVGIRCEGTGLTDNTAGKVGKHQVYLQYGAHDPELSPELLAEARAFSRAVAALAERRRQEEEEAERERDREPLSQTRRGDPTTTWQGAASMDDPDSIF